MLKRRSKRQRLTIRGGAYGVSFTIEASDGELLERLRELLPPAWRGGDAAESGLALHVSRDQSGGYTLIREGRQIASGDAELVLDSFERQVRTHTAFHAPAHVFIHAGAVAYRGLGIVIPGSSFSGKTTLTAALVRAGASYYSDECAIVDERGLVHGYAKPLAMRPSPDSAEQISQTAGDIGGEIATEPVPLALVAAARFRPGAHWEPEQLSPAAAALVLFEHTFQGHNQPEQALQRLINAVRGATGLSGERGEADLAAAEILTRLDRHDE